MKKEDEDKRLHDEAEQGKISQEQKLSELAGILLKTDALTPQELKQKNTEDEKLKIQLLDGSTTSIFEHKKIVAEAKQPYRPLFPNENPFYREAFRLIGLPGNPDDFIKDHRVRMYTLDTVYARFSKDVLPELRKKNPFIKGRILKRKYKLFQFLTPDGRKQIELFRDDVNDLATECKTLYEFGIKFAQTYGLPIQLKLYEEYSPNF